VLPLATELLAACIASGALPAAAATAVADATGGPLATELRRVVAALKLGGDPVASWLSLGSDDVLEPLGAAFSRSASSGAPLAALLSDLAADLRMQQRLAAESAARRVGIRAAAPLGLCFLPAFILLNLVPIVASLVGGLRV
jgi:Flp pilus assembly protein TadB